MTPPPTIPWDALQLDPRPLSAGPSSEIYLATLEGQSVVVKVADIDAEAAALAHLTRRASDLGAAVPAFVGTTTTPSGRRALVRAYVDGLPLSTLIDRALVRRRWQGGRRWNAPTRAIVAALCEATAALHDAGLVHNDLKPDDVLVRLHPDGRIDVVLIDLGLAAPPGRGGPGGTVAYAAPERLGGRLGGLDGELGGSPGTVKSDIWALGAIVFELLAGTRAYPSDQPVDARLERRHLIAETPRPAAARAWRELPPELQDALSAALDPDPRRRPRSARAFAKLLGLDTAAAAALPRPAAASAPAGPAAAAHAAARRSRPALLVTAAVATLAAALLAWGPVASALGLSRAAAVADQRACDAMQRDAARLCQGLSGEASCRAALTATDRCVERARLLAACEGP